MHDLLEGLAPDVDVDAGWDEVRERLESPRRGRAVRLLAVAASVALVAGGVALATLADDDSASNRGPAAVQPGDAEGLVGVSVDLPEGWRQTTLDGEGTPFVASLLLSTMPVHDLDTDRTCAGLGELGPSDALVRIDRRGAADLTGGPFLPPTSDATLPEGTEGSAEWGDCEGIEVDFASRAYGIEAGPRGAAATVFIGTEATAPTLVDVLSLLADVLPTRGGVDEFGPGPVVSFGPDPLADSRLVQETLADFELPPGASLPRPTEGFTQSLAGFTDSVAYSARCEWLRYLVDGFDRGEVSQQRAALAGLNRSIRAHGDAFGIGADVIEEAPSGDSPLARSELSINC